MTINFEHLKPWEALYSDCRLAESNAIEGGRAEHILAMKSLGSGLEKMVAQLTKKAGITDEMVEAHKRQKGKEGRADVFGRIMVLQDRGILDAQSSENYNTLRMLRNNAVHDNNLENASDAKIQKDMEKMYQLMYEESYLFANQYMADGKGSVVQGAGVRNGAGVYNNANRSVYTATPQQASKSSGAGGVIAFIVVIGFIIWLVSSLISLSEYNERSKEFQKQYEQSQQFYEETLQKMKQSEAQFEQTKKQYQQNAQKQPEQAWQQLQQQVQQMQQFNY